MNFELIKEFLTGNGIWTIVGAILGFVSKSIWDRYWKKQDDLRSKQIDLISQQLSEFYLPLYFHLEKDNAVWEKILDRNKEDPLRQKVAKEIEKNFILANHEEIIKIIESKFYLARGEKEFTDEILKYVRHIAVYKALRSAGVWDVDPIYLGEPYPKTFFPIVKKKMGELQKKYDDFLNLN